jgi:FMN hydrolase / 5-amino-6-(5-phospho-D-ribitylamino)uracil phosphatase
MSQPVLLFDVMGTLVHDPFYAEIPAFFGMSLEQLIAEKHPTTWGDFERGEFDEEVLAERFFLDGRAWDMPGLKRVMQSAFVWLEGMEELTLELKGRGFELHAFSNYPVWYQLVDAKLRLSRVLEWSCVSCDLGVRKPAAAAYERALARVGHAAVEVLFVDDREVNCAAARECGIASVHFESAEELRAEFARRGLL